MTATSSRTGILRAELTYDASGESEIACGLELTEETMFVVTDALPPVGARLRIRLSFRHAIEPIETCGVVDQIRMASGPGNPSGFVARFDEAEREAVRTIVERLTAPPSEREPSSQPGSISVLLVEDNRLVRDMFTYAVGKYFARRGRLILDQAPDCETAWERLTTASYDLVLVDHYLPNGDGASLIARIRSEPTLATTSVVAMSIGGSDVRQAALSAGADVFLHKPIVLRDLFHTLEFLMQHGGTDAGAA